MRAKNEVKTLSTMTENNVREELPTTENENRDTTTHNNITTDNIDVESNIECNTQRKENNQNLLEKNEMKGQTKLERFIELSIAATGGILWFTFNRKARRRYYGPIMFSLLLPWLTFQLCRYRCSILKSWGFRIDRDNLRKSFYGPSIFFLLYMIALVVSCLSTGRRIVLDNWHMYASLVLYPGWGLVQHFFVQANLTRNLSYFFLGGYDDLDQWEDSLIAKAVNEKKYIPLIITLTLSAVVFSLVHLPAFWTTIATGVLGPFWAFFYLKDRNLFPLGFYHGIQGTLFYYWWKQQDPW